MCCVFCGGVRRGTERRDKRFGKQEREIEASNLKRGRGRSGGGRSGGGRSGSGGDGEAQWTTDTIGGPNTTMKLGHWPQYKFRSITNKYKGA